MKLLLDENLSRRIIPYRQSLECDAIQESGGIIPTITQWSADRERRTF